MNKKGLLFTLMIFVLLAGLLSLSRVSVKRDSVLNSVLSESNAFVRASDKYSNISNQVVELAKNDAEREIDARILPFLYDIDGNIFSVSSEIPARQGRIDSYLENINAFRVFVEDANYSNEFD